MGKAYTAAVRHYHSKSQARARVQFRSPPDLRPFIHEVGNGGVKNGFIEASVDKRK
jgi:hypothetical protein